MIRLLCATLLLLILAHADKIVLVAGADQDAVGIPTVQAKLKEPFGTEFYAAGNLWIVEMASGSRVLKVDANGMLTHVRRTAQTRLQRRWQPGFAGSVQWPS